MTINAKEGPMTPNRLAREARTERRRASVAAVIGAACALALAFAGCGTTKPAAPAAAHSAPAAVTSPAPATAAEPAGPTHAEFAAQANKLCAKETTDYGESPDALERNADALDREARQIEDLDAPATDRSAQAGYVRAVRKAATVARQIADATRSGEWHDQKALDLYSVATDTSREVTAASAELGAEECGS